MESCCKWCGADLSRGYVTVYDNKGNVKEVICSNCDIRDRAVTYTKTGVLSIRLITQATLEELPGHRQLLEVGLRNRVIREYGAIEVMVKEFEQRVWFVGLQKFVIASRTHGSFAGHNSIKVLVYATAGRVLITISRQDRESITVIAAEKEQEARMGVQSIDATEAQAINLLIEASDLYRDGKLVFTEDIKVSMF